MTETTTTETAEVCPWCDFDIAADDGTTFCGRRGEQMHADCHDESDCRHPDCGR